MKYEVRYKPNNYKRKTRIARYDTLEEAEQAIKDIIAHNKKMHPNLPVADYWITKGK